MAANRRPKFLSDLQRWEANLRVTCRRCPHHGTFDPQQIEQWFRMRGWNTAWDVIGQRFRCDECGTKGASVSMVPKPTPLPLGNPPRPVTERQIKEQIRRSRG